MIWQRRICFRRKFSIESVHKEKSLHKSEILNYQSAINLNVRDAGTHQAYIVASVKYFTKPDIATESIYSRIAEVLKDREMEIVHERIFGSLDKASLILKTRAEMLLSQGISPDNPLTYIQGNPPWGEGLSGIIIRAFSGIVLPARSNLPLIRFIF